MKHSVILVLMLIVSARFVAAHEYADRLKAMLGDDYESAKILGIRDGKYVTTLDLSTLETKKLGEYAPTDSPDGLSRPHWSPDGDLVMFSYGAGVWLMNEDATEQRMILQNAGKVYEPSFWTDPETGGLCIVYKDINYKNGLDRGKAGGTYLARLRSMETERLFDIPCDGGLSLDGTHLGESYSHMAIIDLTTEEVHQPYEGQTCNSTISPDNTYRLMFLRLPHSHFVIWNKYGQELWTLKCPDGSEEWGAPRWSADPDICVSVAKYDDGYKLAVIRISTKEMIVLRNVPGDWNKATVWLKSASETVYTAGAGTMSAEKAMAMLQEAKGLKDAEQAAAVFKEIISRAADTAAASEAKQVLASDPFNSELKAAPALKDLWNLVTRLAPSGQTAKYDDPAYFKRNRSVLILMTRKAQEIRDNNKGTRAYEEAIDIAAKYGLPDSTALALSETLKVDATVEAISRVPTAAQIAPYREVITYVRHTVDDVVAGDYEQGKIITVHWGMKDAKHMAAASWKPGQKLRLTLDRFDSHPELWRVTTASGADDVSLTPYWAIKAEER